MATVAERVGDRFRRRGHLSLRRRAKRTTGAVNIREGNPTLRETQMLATAEDDGLLRWKKLPNPVIAAPPTGLAVTGFRDPCPWHEATAGI